MVCNYDMVYGYHHHQNICMTISTIVLNLISVQVGKIVLSIGFLSLIENLIAKVQFRTSKSTSLNLVFRGFFKGILKTLWHCLLHCRVWIFSHKKKCPSTQKIHFGNILFSPPVYENEVCLFGHWADNLWSRVIPYSNSYWLPHILAYIRNIHRYSIIAYLTV